MTKKRTLITAALPYVNNVPHLGNVIPTLSADVYHRFLKLSGHESIYICGTDEHGTRTEIEAAQRNMSPDDYCRELHAKILKLYNWLGIEFDNFGRTSSRENHKLTQEIFLNLYKNNYIFEDTITQLYCKNCERYLPDTYVEGECPHCKSGDAKGDQCDECLKVLEPGELVNPKCKICGSTPEIRETKHLFLDLPKLSHQLENWINSTNWTGIIKNLPLAWIKEGLKPRCITRDLKWGVPVPLDGFEDKVFYVWFDAPIGYIASTAEYAEKTGSDWKPWWKNNDANVVHFIGKDNVPFHAIIWPSMLIGARDNWNLPSYISSNEYLNYEGGQFSKSRKRGVFSSDIINLKFTPDVWRFYLMIIRPEAKDADFDWKDLMDKVNNELIGNFGNFINRTITFTHKNFGEIPGAEYSEEDKETINAVEYLLKEAGSEIKAAKIKEALKTVLRISDLGNKYFQKNKPWELVKEDKKRCAAVLNVCCNIAGTLAVAIAPFMPETAENIWKQLGNGDSVRNREWKIRELPANQKLNKPEILFEKIPQKLINEYEKQFAGREFKVQEKEECLFEKLDLRVAEITEVDDHPDADKLYKLKINIGTEERQIVAGLKNYYDKEELRGRIIVVLLNLEPAVIRGVESEGMLLAADDGKNVKVLDSDESPAGAVVFVEGVKQNKIKIIKYDDFIKCKMTADESGRILYKNKPLKTESGEIKASGVKKGAKVR
ncbi:methionine--tRNA ligase [Candidatus Altiarchaeales archaeon WOR_SM1_SCG]|nr:methionine--tRNA ligase [Candidatus Altiarchaeales archaeon WOR_SM1_SCG]